MNSTSGPLLNMAQNLYNQGKRDAEKNQQLTNVIHVGMSLAVVYFSRNIKNYFGQVACITPLISVVTGAYVKPTVLGVNLSNHLHRNGYDSNMLENLTPQDIEKINRWKRIMSLVILCTCLYPKFLSIIPILSSQYLTD